MTDSKKTQAYIEDGIFVGGDRAVDAVVIKDIRRAKNGDLERIVLDLEGSINGEPSAIGRSPYYQVAVNKEEGRVVVTIWGKPRLQFEPAKVMKGFQKSALISSIEMLPKLESDSWTFVLGFKDSRSIEVFELADPVRIILDVKQETKKKVRLAPAHANAHKSASEHKTGH